MVVTSAPGEGGIPAKVSKDQIRRIGVIYTPNYSSEMSTLMKFLDQCALSFSKKPLYLRKVFSEIISPTANARLLLEKVKSLEVVALMGVLEGLPEAKIREINEVMIEGDVMFRSVAPAEVQKKSLALDMIVDMMLLNPES